MNKEKVMTGSEKKKLLKDFKEWSGGFAPKECTGEDVGTYIAVALSTDAPDEAAEWLREQEQM